MPLLLLLFQKMREKIDDAIEEDFDLLGEGTTTTDDFNFISEKVKMGSAQSNVTTTAILLLVSHR